MKKIIVLDQDAANQRLDKLTLDKIAMRFTYDTTQNINSVTFDAPKKDMPDTKTLLDMILNINATWSSVLRSTALINQSSQQNTNTLSSKIVSSSGTISFIQGTSDLQDGTNSLNPVLASNPTAGNILFIGVSIRKFPLITVSSIVQTNVVWTQVLAASANNDNTELWKGVASAGALASAVVNLSGTMTEAQANLVEFAGITGTIDKSASSNGNSANPDTGTTAATATAKELWIGVLGMEDDYSATMLNPTNSFILLGGEPNGYIANGVVYKIASATGTANCSVTGYPTGSAWHGVIATFT